MPKARCVGEAVVVVATSGENGDPVVWLFFQNGDHLFSFLSNDAYTIQGSAIVLPVRPVLNEELREHVPAQYRGLFDYGLHKGKFG